MTSQILKNSLGQLARNLETAIYNDKSMAAIKRADRFLARFGYRPTVAKAKVLRKQNLGITKF